MTGRQDVLGDFARFASMVYPDVAPDSHQWHEMRMIFVSGVWQMLSILEALAKPGLPEGYAEAVLTDMARQCDEFNRWYLAYCGVDPDRN